MNRTARLTLSFVSGVLGAYVFMATKSGYSLFDDFNRKACDDQAPFKVLEAKLPTNGNSSYDSKREKCVYRYLDSDNIPRELVWNP